MVGAQVGNGPHLGILILLIGLVVLGHVVDSVVIGLAVGIHHGCLVSLMGAALLMHVPLLLAVATHDVGVSGSIGATFLNGPGQILLGWEPVVTSSNCGHLLDLLFSWALPSNGTGPLRLEVGLYRCYL